MADDMTIIARELLDERDRLKAELAAARQENQALRKRCEIVEKFAHWFSKYPEYKPNPDMIDEVVADRNAYRIAAEKEGNS